MKFIKELISTKNWSGSKSDEAFGEDELRRDLEAGFDSPLVNRSSHRDMAEAQDAADEFEEFEVLFDADEDPEVVAEPETEPEEWVAEPEAMTAAEDDGEFEEIAFEEDNDLEPEPWNIGLDDADIDEDADDLIMAGPEPEAEAEAEEIEIFDDPLFQDEEHAAEIELAAMEAVNNQAELSEDDKSALLDEIRTAMEAVRHMRSDDDVDRQSTAREQLGDVADPENGARLFDATDSIMDEDANTRRRQAIALMKAAAAATRIDPKLQAMTGRDAAGDPKEQSDYRQDLAALTKPDHGSARPHVETRPLDLQDEPELFDAPAADHEDPQDFVAPEEQSTNAVDDQAGFGTAYETPVEDAAQEPDPEDELDEGWAEIVGAQQAEEAEALEPAAPAEPSEPDAEKTDKMEELRKALLSARSEPTDAYDEDEPDTGIEYQEDAAEAIWDIEAAQSDPTPEPAVAAPVAAVIPSAGGRQAGRVKTRLLGFSSGADEDDPFASQAGPSSAGASFPVGWLVVTDGPGHGRSFSLASGVSQIGRGEGQTVRLDFGDTSISREYHAAIAYDEEQNAFFVGHGGKSNLVRLNTRPVLSTEPLASGDTIRVGETTLRFVAFCDDGFSWSQANETPAGRAAIA